MSDAPADEKPKVISLHTRAAFKPDPTANVADDEPDPLTMEALNQMHELAEKGDLKGVMILGWNEREQHFYTSFVGTPGVSLDNSGVRFMGGMELMKAMLLEMTMTVGEYNVEAQFMPDEESDE